MDILAQSVKINNKKITGPLDPNVNWSLGEVINRLMLVIVPFAGVLLFLILIWGGYDFLLSGGNAEKVKKGKQKIGAALAGFLLLVLSYLAVKIVSQVFGLGEGLFK